MLKSKFFLPTIVINLNNGKSDKETNGSREGDKEFAPADSTRPSTGVINVLEMTISDLG